MSMESSRPMPFWKSTCLAFPRPRFHLICMFLADALQHLDHADIHRHLLSAPHPISQLRSPGSSRACPSTAHTFLLHNSSPPKVSLAPPTTSPCSNPFPRKPPNGPHILLEPPRLRPPASLPPRLGHLHRPRRLPALHPPPRPLRADQPVARGRSESDGGLARSVVYQ